MQPRLGTSDLDNRSDVPESSLSSQSRVRATSPSSQSHLKFFESSQSRVMTWSSRFRAK